MTDHADRTVEGTEERSWRRFSGEGADSSVRKAPSCLAIHRRLLLRRSLLPQLLLFILTLHLGVACSTDPGFGGRSAEEWIEQLQSAPDSLQRREAADALGRILELNPGSKRVTEALVQSLADTSDDVRLSAGTALIHERRLPRVAIPGLVRALADSAHAHTREHVAQLLAAVSPRDAGEVLPALAQALDDPDPNVREAVVLSLVRLGRDAPDAAAAVTTLLQRARASATPSGRAAARRALLLLRPRSGTAATSRE